jgi:hypothetical protein
MSDVLTGITIVVIGFFLVATLATGLGNIDRTLKEALREHACHSAPGGK